MHLIKDHDGEGPDEPPGGWQSGPTLADTELITVQLCRFTGVILEGGERCPDWGTVHREVDCAQTYVSVEQVAWWLHQLPTEERRPYAWRERPEGQ